MKICFHILYFYYYFLSLNASDVLLHFSSIWIYIHYVSQYMMGFSKCLLFLCEMRFKWHKQQEAFRGSESVERCWPLELQQLCWWSPEWSELKSLLLGVLAGVIIVETWEISLCQTFTWPEMPCLLSSSHSTLPPTNSYSHPHKPLIPSWNFFYFHLSGRSGSSPMNTPCNLVSLSL